MSDSPSPRGAREQSASGVGLSRRRALTLGAAFVSAGCFGWPALAESKDPVEQAIEKAHAEIWSRFIDKKYFTFYDYAGLDGTVILPTQDECTADRPNALAWWTPIENGSFFGGLYLDGLCNRWLLRRDTQTATEAGRIAQGLLRLASVGQTTGFIARGVAADGHSHYAAGSDDQTFPWFYGLWRYLKSGIPAAAEKAQIIRKIEEVARVLERSGWRMPCDRKELGFRGSMGEFNYIQATRLLFVLRAVYDVTQDSHWLGLYREKLAEKSNEAGVTRLEICATGARYESPGPRYRPGHPDNAEFWTSASCQAALRALSELEDDGVVQNQFRHGLEVNAVKALEHVERFEKFDNDNGQHFEADWRFLNDLWQPQTRIDNSVSVALVQVREWNKRSPKRRSENESMREPLFAAWIVTLSGNEELIQHNRNVIRAALKHYEWSKLNTSLFFIAENVYYEGLKRGL